MKNIYTFIKEALKEDIASQDVTSNLLIDNKLKCKARLSAKQDGVICGLEIVKIVFLTLDKSIKFIPCVKDGSFVKNGKVLATISGAARSILTGERVSLNFLSHLSGIATKTRDFVNKVRPYKTKILDTRKTLPGLRALQKYAVRCGGGVNHRMSLSDQILIKDNHLSVLRSAYSVQRIIEKAKQMNLNGKKIEIEVDNLKKFKEALKAKPDIIMLDNLTLREIREAVIIKRTTHYALRTTKLEVSGNVTLSNVRSIAKTGVDMISIGSLTHSSPSLDISLEIIK